MLWSCVLVLVVGVLVWLSGVILVLVLGLGKVLWLSLLFVVCGRWLSVI